MSFNVKSYLIDIDREIVAHRQEIAKRRLRISELEDTRVLMMQREEYRAELAGETSPFGALPGGGEIAVRERRLMDEGVLSLAAKTGALPPPGLNKSGNLRGMTVAKGKGSRPRGKFHGGHGKGRHSKNTAVGAMRDKVVKMLSDATEPMSGSEIGNYLGLPAGTNEPRKALQNALYWMRVHGALHRDPEHRYSLPMLSRPNGGAHA